MVHFSVLALNKLGFEVDAYGLNIDAEIFFQFLKQNRTNQDSKIIKKQNILREISTFKNGLFEDDGVKKLRVTSVFVQCQLDYFETIGHHEASLPNFISKGCLSKLDDGSIQIELGSDTFIQDQKSLITIEENTLKEKLRQCQQSDNKKSRATKRRLLDTPQKGKSGKRVQTQSTPRKLKTTD